MSWAVESSETAHHSRKHALALISPEPKIETGMISGAAAILRLLLERRFFLA
jgi:hypothetical protein